MSPDGPVPGARLGQSSLGPDDVGRRVVVRHLLPDGRATDVLGELVRVGPVLVVQPDGAGPVTVTAAAVVAAKVVPPRTVVPRSSIDAVQSVADHGWPGLDRERLGGWVLRAGAGFTGRANSALPTGNPGLPADEAVAAVERFYDDRGLTPAVQVPFGLTGGDDPAPGLDADLAGRGWTHDPPTLLMTATLRGRVPVSGLDLVRFDPEPDAAWLGLYRYRGGELPPRARDVLVSGPRDGWLGFASLRRDRRTLATCRVAVGAGWVGVTAMQTADDAQRQGLGRLVLDAALGWGAERGARHAYLQVYAANSAAVALYTSTGFTAHHRYHYRRRRG